MEHTNLYTCLYARRSNEDDKDGESIENQVNLLRQYCANEGYLNIMIFTDDGYTGTNFDRPDFQKMFSLIKHRHVKRVIVKDLSRFGRNNLEVSRYLGVEFPRYDVEFISIIDGPGSSDPDNLITQVKNMMNEFYAKDISEKQKHSLRARSNNGQHIASSPVFGYKVDPENYMKSLSTEDVQNPSAEIYDKLIEKVVVGKAAGKGEINFGKQQVDIYLYGIGKIGDLVDLSYKTFANRVLEVLPEMLKNKTYSMNALCEKLGLTYSILKIGLQREKVTIWKLKNEAKKILTE